MTIYSGNVYCIFTIYRKDAEHMNEFLQTLLIAAVPSLVAGILSYLAARKNAKAQIDSIQEQNKADIEKIVKQHKLEMETLEKKHTQEIELLEKQYDKETKKGEEEIKNQLAANVITGMFSGLFSANSPIMEQLSETILQNMKQPQNSPGE